MWSGRPAAPTVDVNAADTGAVANCTGWKYTVAQPHSAPTVERTIAGSAPPAKGLPLTCSDTPTSDGWSVSIGYNDLSGTAQTATVPVTGPPPS